MAVQILVRERLEARCEELRSQTSNRPPITMTTMRKHQLVEAAVTELLWSRDRAERETVGQVRLALRELRRQEEELQPERKKLLPPGWKRIRAEEIKELALERNISMTGPDGKRQVKEALIRDLLRWCERQTEPETAPFGACAADVPITTAAESAQSRDEFLETPTGDGRRCLRDSDGSKTLNTVLAVLGSSRGRTTRRILSRTWEPGGGWPWQGVEANDSELKYKLPREQPMTSGQKRRWESGARHFFGNDGSALVNPPGV